MKLNLPEYHFKTRINTAGKNEIFDNFRKKFIIVTPEEWVRQNFLQYLTEIKNYPASLIAVEKGIKVNNMQRRFDAVVYSGKGKPLMLIEFKSPDIKISQKVMDQISQYNLSLNVNYLIVSNGLSHYCCKLNREAGTFEFLIDIPNYEIINDE